MIEMNKDAFLEEVRIMFPNGHPDFYKKMVELCDLHSRKNHDYASNEDPMSNFNRVGELADTYGIWGWDTPASFKVATLYMLKQFDAFMNLLKCKKEGKVEGVSDRLGDVTVYSVIMDILYKEGRTTAPPKGMTAKYENVSVVMLPGEKQKDIDTYLRIAKIVESQ